MTVPFCYHKFVLRGKLMDKTLKEKIIDSTFEGLDKVIEKNINIILMRILIPYVDYKRAIMIT